MPCLGWRLSWPLLEEAVVAGPKGTGKRQLGGVTMFPGCVVVLLPPRDNENEEDREKLWSGVART